MDLTQSASRAVNSVQNMLVGRATPTEAERARSLQSLIIEGLNDPAHSTALLKFLSDPVSRSNRDEVVEAVTQKLRSDTAFRSSISDALQPPAHSGISVGGSINAEKSDFAGRDLDKSKKTHFGGILVAVVAVVALFLVGREVVVSMASSDEGGSLTGKSTCREFLAASSAEQVAVLKRVYLDAGKTERAGDPFILQNGVYLCGGAPSLTLEALAQR
ncbi:hypothetical protein [Amycolatopsis magusensis]|uniref:hypothetical protein n=1 Tax=Amycolatopsis magusensis TaxID=882444 RepID=UPI0024A91BFD|nr:hypothetical protein [Amycolatopsis magusensis]MDI5974994.1 hypothetical protein [Amycolatopsis magusensis]